MKLIFVLSLVLSLSLADKLPNTFYSAPAPYPPSGWKPNGAGLQLPSTEYGPPAVKDDDSSNVEITQERIEYAGQLVESSTTSTNEEPNNSYLPPNTNTDFEQPSEVPTTDNSLNVQGLPPTDSPVNFNSQYRQLNTGEFIPSVGRQQQEQQQRVVFNRQNGQQFGQIRQQQQQQQQFQQFRQTQAQQQQQLQQQRQQFQSFPLNSRIQTNRNSGRFTQQPFGKIQRQDVVPDAPQEDGNQQGESQDPSQEQTPQEQPPQEPFDQYGPPAPATSRQPKNNEPNFNNNNNNNNDYDDGNQQQFNDEDDTQSEADHGEDDVNTDEQPSIAIANSFANGQYYILSKDNTLQRVIYMTTQTEEDRINNGFTAQLRYSPVAPIQDPIYAFDAQGQLIRIYNKK